MFMRVKGPQTVSLSVKDIMGFSFAVESLRQEIGSLRSLMRQHDSTEGKEEGDDEGVIEESLLGLRSKDSVFCIESLMANDTAIRRFTFAPSWAAFDALVCDLQTFAHPRMGKGSLNLHNIVAMCIMRLRFNLTLEFLAVLFFGKIESCSNVKKIIDNGWLLLDEVLFSKTVQLLPAAEIRRQHLPPDFADALPGSVLVMDCTYQYFQSTWGIGMAIASPTFLSHDNQAHLSLTVKSTVITRVVVSSSF